MAGHGIRQFEERVRERAAAGIHTAVCALHELELDRKYHRPPNRPSRRTVAKRVTPETIVRVKDLWTHTKMNQQEIASLVGLGTGGRVTEILDGKWDHILEGKTL